MTEARSKGVAVLDGDGEVVRKILIKIVYGATTLAHEVVVSRLVNPMVADAPIAEMGDSHESKLAQGVEGAINSGDIHKRIGGSHLRENLFGTNVVIRLLEGVENKQALGRKAQTGILKALRQLCVIIDHNHHLK